MDLIRCMTSLVALAVLGCGYSCEFRSQEFRDVYDVDRTMLEMASQKAKYSLATPLAFRIKYSYVYTRERELGILKSEEV